MLLTYYHLLWIQLIAKLLVGFALRSKLWRNIETEACEGLTDYKATQKVKLWGLTFTKMI